MAGPKEGPHEWSGAIPVPEDEMDDYSEDCWTTPLSNGRAPSRAPRSPPPEHPPTP